MGDQVSGLFVGYFTRAARTSDWVICRIFHETDRRDTPNELPGPAEIHSIKIFSIDML